MHRLRMILNTFYSGPQAWFFVAEDRGYFRDAGIEIEFVEGDTAANAIPRVGSGEFDIGYGDLNALIELKAADDPKAAALGVFAMFNWCPYTITVPARGPVQTLRELHGVRIASHENDAAWRMLPELARAADLDEAKLNIEFTALRHRDILPLLGPDGRWDAAFGFVNTHRAAAIEAGIDPDSRFRYFAYRDVLPDLYGCALCVGTGLAQGKPDLVTALVAAVNRGVADTLADIDAAIDAVAQRAPDLDRAANRERLMGTLAFEMSHAEGARIGIGAVDEARLARAIDLIVAAKGLARRPAPEEVFTNRFLPETTKRVRSLARNQEPTRPIG